MSSNLKLIKKSRTSGARLLSDGVFVHKIYSQSDRGYHSSRRQPGEIFWLKHFRDEPWVVNIVEEKPPGKHIVIEKHGDAIGVRGKLSNLRKQNIDAMDLLAFLNAMQDELNKHNVNHGDITPENICYDPAKRSFVLIDFAFAMFRSEFTGGRSEAWLSPINSIAINMIKSQVYAQLASRIKLGGIYSPLPFDDIGPMKCQGAPHGLIWSGIDGFMKANNLGWNAARVLDIGCGSGRFSFLALEHGANSVTAIEGDDPSYELLKAALIGRRISPDLYRLRNEMITPDCKFEGPYDFCFMLNILMWINHTQGRKFMEQLLTDIGKICPRIFVMSSIRNGPGMYQLNWLHGPQAEFKYYRSLGFKTTLLARIPIWKRHRHLYCLEWCGKHRVPI